jgi:hypothetical protein
MATNPRHTRLEPWGRASAPQNGCQRAGSERTTNSRLRIAADRRVAAAKRIGLDPGNCHASHQVGKPPARRCQFELVHSKNVRKSGGSPATLQTHV